MLGGTRAGAPARTHEVTLKTKEIRERVFAPGDAVTLRDGRTRLGVV